MFRVQKKKRNGWIAAYELAETTYHMTVRASGGSRANPLFSLVMNIVTQLFMFMALYLTMTLLHMRPTGLRGDFVVYLMSGVMAYTTYNKTMKAVYGAEGPLSPMMQHGPMNTIVAIASAAISTLYLQVFSTLVILGGYHVAITPVHIDEPVFAFFMMVASWIFGIATGLLVMAIKPWAPKLAPILIMIVTRINVFASGKMMLGNSMAFWQLKLFDWNPLFHCVDQMRGAIFLNYIPRNTEVPYIFKVSAAMIVLGLMGEFFTRRRVSASWFAR